MKRIPLVFTIDDNYAKFLSITLTSILKHASKDNFYIFYIFNPGLHIDSIELLNKFNTANSEVKFVSCALKAQTMVEDLPIRDYYSRAIYYRIFTQSLLPNEDKVLYMDSDIVVLDDIAKLYNTDIGDNLVGAVPDYAVSIIDEFILYVEEALGIKYTNYFNSGVMILNLKKFREVNLEEQFISTLNKFKFDVAPDQDCLNVLCKDQVYYIDTTWNKMPLGENYIPSLVHYNLTFKPWKYDNIMYEEYFWENALNANVIDEIKEIKASFTEAMAKRDLEGGELLKAKCVEEAHSYYNYRRITRRENSFFYDIYARIRILIRKFTRKHA